MSAGAARESSKPLLLGRGSVAAFVASVLAGAASAAFSRPALSAGELAATLLLLTSSLALGLAWRRGDPRGLRRYFLLQTALAAAAMVASHGRGAVALMPLISQSVLVLPRAAVGGYGLLLCALFVGGVSRGVSEPGRLAFHALSFLTAAVFTWVFSALAAKERQAREEIERLAAALREATGELERLATERERNRLARELHDGVGHALTVAHVQLEAARAVLARDPQKADSALRTAGRMLQEGLQDLRQSVSTLRGPVHRTLPELLRELVEAPGGGELVVQLEVSGEVRPLGPAAELALYRAAQEGLTNVRRHAAATSAAVRLVYGPRETLLEIADDGRTASPLTGGFGLVGMRERVELLGGSVEPERPARGGLTLRIRVPSPGSASAA